MSSQFKVAITQYPLSQLSEFYLWKLKIEDWVTKAAKENCRLLLFPEYAGLELTSLASPEKRMQLVAQAELVSPYLDQFHDTFSKLSALHKIIIVAPSIPFAENKSKTVNRVFIYSPSGKKDFQDKLFMTRFEDEDWGVSAGDLHIKIFRTAQVSFFVSTCFDIEFSLPSVVACQAGAQLILVPSCTETIKGSHRVHVGARARALENQCYVLVSQTVGTADWSPAVDQNVGRAAVYSTPDIGFPDDGILFEGDLDNPQIYFVDLDISQLGKVRDSGAVFNFQHHKLHLSQLNHPFKLTTVDLT